MNERIEELVEQARRYANEYVEDEVEKQFHKKFVELIIRECISCCEQVISDPVPESVDTWLNGGEQCIQEIKEHFGVE